MIRERIQNHLGAAKRFGNVIRAWIVAACEKAEPSSYGDSESRYLEQYVEDIEQLAEMPEGL